MNVKMVAEMLVKTIYFLVIVTASIVMVSTASGEITGRYAVAAGVTSVVVLALTLFLFLSCHISWGEKEQKDDSCVQDQTKQEKQSQ